ncbi:MAG: hypothetical protein ABI474_09235 [Actinomycetota bacterium]
MAIAMDPSTPGGSVAFDAAQGDQVTASIAAPLGSYPERLVMNARRVPLTGPQTSAAVTISGSDTLVVGQNGADGRLQVDVNGSGCAVTSGTITIDELSRVAIDLTSFSGSFDAISCTGKPIRGVLRWHSSLPYTALKLTSQVVDAGLVEVGQSAIDQITVTNIGNRAAAVWPSFSGLTASEWSAATSSTCDSGAELAPAATCTFDVVFSPSGGDQRQATMGVPSPDGPGTYDVSLTGIGVGQPTPPTDVQANSSVFGAVVTWGLPTNFGGAWPESAKIEKTTDRGLSWSTLAIVTGASLDRRTYADGLGVAPGAEVGYRVSTTQLKVVPGQTTTYSSEVSAVAVTTGARQSFVIDAVSGMDGYRPIVLRGSMNPDVPARGFFLPSTDNSPWDQSPDGSEIVMASTGAGTIEKLYELRRRPALGRTVASTAIYAGVYPITEVAWSPDGASLAWREYHRENSESYLMVGSATGGSVRALNLTDFSEIRWLPDSRTLVGVSNTPNGYVVSFVDTRTAVLTQTATLGGAIGLAPDARRLVTLRYDANYSNMFFDIYTLDPNTRSLSAPVRTQKPYRVISGLEFSPDGRELLTSGRNSYAQWPLDLASGKVVLDPFGTSPGDVQKIAWHSYRPTLALSPATTGPTATFAIQGARMAPGTIYQCAVDDKTLAGCSTSWTTGSLVPGRHTARVIGTEPSGRSAASARTWTVTAPTLYTAISPRRVMDTRNGTNTTKAKLAGGGRVTLTIPGLPVGATAVTLNITVTGPTSAGYLTAYPAGSAQPTTSNLNFVAGQTVANLVMVSVGSGGKVTFFNSAGTVDVIADLAGYYLPAVGRRFIARPADRIMDTRIGLGASKATVGPGLVTLGVQGLPAGTTAVALNVTVTKATAASYLTVYPAGTTRPTASNLNFVKGQTIANVVIVPVGTGGRVTFYNNAGTVDILADLAGVYTTGTGARFTAQAPGRVLDTRIGIGAPISRVSHTNAVTLTLPDLPDGVTAIALTVTAVKSTVPSNLAVNPSGQQPSGTFNVVSNVNYLANQIVPNLVVVGVGPNNTVTFTTDAGTVDVVADLAGYFRP